MQDSIWERRIHQPFVLAALGIALTEGFGYAALLVAALALKLPLGDWWGASVQAHGHAQLFGWMGLFILGMGLYFLPRLRGARLAATQYAPFALALLTSGIVLHSLAQPALGFAAPASLLAMALRAAFAASAALELAGVAQLARVLAASHLAQGPIAHDAPVHPVIPFIVIAAASLALAFLAMTLGTLGAAFAQRATISAAWDSLVIQLMLYGLALPMAFVFSVRNLPLFLRLAAPPRDELRPLALVYALGLVLRLAPDLAGIFDLNAAGLNPVGALGVLLQSAVVLVFVWWIDLLRRRPPWTVSRPPNTRPDLEYLRKPTRKNYPDAGEYGRFELLIYSAYLWLVLSALLGIIRSGGLLLGGASSIPADAERHALTVGFITVLIFGMAVRMGPGFSGKRRVAYPRLVLATFVLGNLAALLRVVPLFFPSSDLFLALFGASGAIGWLAVAALAANVTQTFAR